MGNISASKFKKVIKRSSSFALVELAAILLSSLRMLLRALPPRQMLALCATVGGLLGRLRRRELEISKIQLAFAFPEGDPRRNNNEPIAEKEKSSFYETISLEIFRHAGELFGEALIFDKLLSRDRLAAGIHKENTVFHYISSPSVPVVRHVEDLGRGAVCLTSHLGCYELLAAYIIEQGVRLTIIARKPNYPRLASHLDELRQRYGAEVIWRNEPKAAKKLLKAFKERRVVAALIDQDTDVQNDFVPFFGLKAAVPSAPIKFAIQRGIPVYSAFIARHARMKHLVFIEEIPYEQGDPGAVHEIIGSYNKRLEELLRLYPEQWWWWHRRWRRRPEVDYAVEPEKLRSTKDYLLWLEEQTLRKHRPVAGGGA